MMTPYEPSRHYRDRCGRTLVVIDVTDDVVTYAIRGVFTDGPLRASAASFARLIGERVAPLRVIANGCPR